jgi:hypothetical protein
MTNIAEPPFLLDSARVVLYAETGGSASYTGRITVHADGRWLEPVPRLAICEDLVDGDIFIFHCDDSWNVFAAGGASPLRTPDRPRNLRIPASLQNGSRIARSQLARLPTWNPNAKSFACSPSSFLSLEADLMLSNSRLVSDACDSALRASFGAPQPGR